MKQPKKNHTHIVCLIDKSGSMNSIRQDTIGGFNAFLKDQKAATNTEHTATISLYQFDDQYETTFENIDINDAKELNTSTYCPRGMTALFDSLGKTIVSGGEYLSKEPAEHVVFVIITDGHENSSHEYTQDKVFAMIKEQQDKWNWQFVFLGANQDAIKAAGGLGIHTANAMTYAANSKGVEAAFISTSSNLRSMRGGTKLNMSYEKEDYDAQAEAGVTNS